MILDSLTHVTQDGQWFQTQHRADVETLLASMQDANVSRSMLVGMPGALSTNANTLKVANRYPDQFIPIAALELLERSQQEIEHQIRLFKQDGFLGLKIHPRLSGVSIEDKRIAQAMAMAGEYDLPVLLCTVCKPPHPPLTSPITSILQGLCQENPKTRIILLHGGYTNLLELSELIRPLENVLLDLSATLPRFYQTSLGLDIQFLVRTFEKRLCVGSDFPEYSYSDVLHAFKYLGFSASELSEKGILGSNLFRMIQGAVHAPVG